MSKKKHKHRSVNRAIRGIVSGLSILVPPELSVPVKIDETRLHTAIKTKLTALEEQIQRLRKEAGVHRVEVVPAPIVQAFGHIATSVWRAKNKIVNPDTGEAKDEMKRVYRDVTAISEVLEQIGVKTIDPAGRAYDSGMALKVISFEATPGLSKEEIKETIKPTVEWDGRRIQMGEVIIGTPQKTTEAERGTGD